MVGNPYPSCAIRGSAGTEVEFRTTSVGSSTTCRDSVRDPEMRSNRSATAVSPSDAVLIDCRERHQRVARELDVVIPDDRDLACRQPALGHGSKRADRQGVVAGEYRSGWLLLVKQTQRGLVGGVLRRIGDHDLGGQSLVGHALQVRRFADRVRWAGFWHVRGGTHGQVRDACVPQGEQVIHRQRDTSAIVVGDRVVVARLVMAAEQYHGHILGQSLQRLRPHVQRNGDDPINLSIDQRIEHLLVARALQCRSDDQLVATARQLPGSAGRDLREEVIAKLGDLGADRDGVGLPTHAASPDARPIAERIDRLLHPLTHGRADAIRVADHLGHGTLRDAGVLGDVPKRGPSPAFGLCTP